MKQEIIERFIKDNIGTNEICAGCANNNDIIPIALTPYLISDFSTETKNRIMFIGKTARGNDIGEEVTENLQDVTEFGREFITNSSWAYYSYTREIIESYFGNLEKGILHTSFSNMVKCNNESMEDTTSGDTKICCIDKNQFIWKEIDIIKPKRLIFYTHNSYDYFIEKFRPSNCQSIKDITDINNRIDIGEKTSLFWHREFYDKNNNLICSFLRTSHPMMKNKEDFVDSILTWLKETEEGN